MTKGMDKFYCPSVLAYIRKQPAACGVKGLLLVNPEMLFVDG